MSLHAGEISYVLIDEDYESGQIKDATHTPEDKASLYVASIFGSSLDYAKKLKTNCISE